MNPLIAIFAAVAVAIPLGLLIFAHYSHAKDKSRWFIERQQLQSKVDTLTESMLRHSGVQIDLNRHVRESFKRKADNAFGFGWKADLPATPTPLNKTEDK